MRNTIVGAAGVVALVATALPAVAGAAPRHVDGTRFGHSGGRAVTQTCTDPGAVPEKPSLRVRRGPGTPPRGERALQWRPAGDEDLVGVVMHVDKPSEVTKYSVRVHAAKDGLLGQAVVYYPAPDDYGTWQGNASVPVGAAGGWRKVDAADVVFSWRRYNDGLYVGSAPDARLASFVEAQGGDGQGARLGFAFGCGAGAFALDTLQLGSDDRATTYDFEGYRTSAALLVGGKTPARRTITVGRAIELGGRLFQKVGDRRIAGTLAFQAKRSGTKGFRTVDRDKTTRRRTAGTRVRPARATTYRISYAGTEANESDTSNLLTVRVRVAVGARLVDDTITRGEAFTVTGRVRPGKVTKIQLQRYVNGSWTTIKRGRTARDGDYRIGMTPSSAGTSYWRIKALSGGGNVGNTSKSVKLTVRSPSGGGGGGNDDPPPPPPDDPTDPPPPPPEGRPQAG
jgi:hypothetical protein